MKSFLKKILISGCVFILSLVLIAIISHAIFSASNVNYLASFEDKVNLIKQNSGRKRIVFVGGSSLTFGLNSKILSDSLNVDVVNLSLHGGIGLNNEIDLFLRYFDKERDIIIISAEFETLASFDEKFVIGARITRLSNLMPFEKVNGCKSGSYFLFVILFPSKMIRSKIVAYYR